MFLAFKIALSMVFIAALFILSGNFASDTSEISKMEFPKTENYKEVEEIVLEIKKEQVVKEEVLSTEPLRVMREEVKMDTSLLTVGGTISWTNFFRQTSNLPPLKENDNLNSVAQSKLNDMFSRQYFEHVSPGGEGAGDIAKKFGYKFVLIGENLAIGDFVSDEDVVRAWMDSPGHKANILKQSYTEIGVATKKGMFNGREVWMSVQIFASPFSLCKSPDETLILRIESNKAQIKSTKEHLDLLRAAIEEEKYQTREEYEKMVAEYNSLIPSYNFLSQSTKSLVDEYNSTVLLFNQCVESIE